MMGEGEEDQQSSAKWWTGLASKGWCEQKGCCNQNRAELALRQVYTHKLGCAYRTALCGKLSFPFWEVTMTKFFSEVPVWHAYVVQGEAERAGTGYPG